MTPLLARPPFPQMQPTLPPPSQKWPDKGAFPYTACFCEENVYWLARWLHSALPSTSSSAVVWISNAHKAVSSQPNNCQTTTSADAGLLAVGAHLEAACRQRRWPGILGLPLPVGPAKGARADFSV